MTAQKSQANLDISATADHCPFFDSACNICRAALLGYTPDARQLYCYCSSDDHDACGLFLARALRSSNPGGLDRDMAAHCGK